MRIPVPNYTQAPNELFDEWLPKLSFVELKVLMVIVRKTFGWHKVRDRISLSQLEKFTGAQRQAILSATKSLQNLGLINKIKVGESGTEQTFYELVVIEDSNSLYQCDSHTPHQCDGHTTTSV
ncbi:MAG TPA: replication protein, partial [Rhabdochlamydiaceae bacterium]